MFRRHMSGFCYKLIKLDGRINLNESSGCPKRSKVAVYMYNTKHNIRMSNQVGGVVMNYVTVDERSPKLVFVKNRKAQVKRIKIPFKLHV